MSQPEKEEPGISKEFSLEIEKYAKLEGVTSEELIQQATKDRLEKLKQIYPDKTETVNKTQKTENIQLAKSEACVITLEMVAAQLNESDDISVIKNVIAGDLLVAKIAFDLEKNGKVEQEQVKKYVAELF
jgi:hypothetical protein